jgi:hypothetical protein
MDLSRRMHKPLQGRIIFDSPFETLSDLVEIAISRLQKGDEEIEISVNIRGVRNPFEINYTLGTRTVMTHANIPKNYTPLKVVYRKLKRLTEDYSIRQVRNCFFLSKG